MKSYLPLIMGMALATYLPRFIPLLILKNRQVNDKLREFLYYIPYTSLSILIIRGIITTATGMKLATILAVGVAGLISYRRSQLILSVVAGIFLAFLILM